MAGESCSVFSAHKDDLDRRLFDDDDDKEEEEEEGAFREGGGIDGDVGDDDDDEDGVLFGFYLFCRPSSAMIYTLIERKERESAVRRRL